GALLDVFVRDQRERRGFAGAMAGGAVLVDDRRDIFGKGDLVSRGEQSGRRKQRNSQFSRHSLFHKMSEIYWRAPEFGLNTWKTKCWPSLAATLLSWFGPGMPETGKSRVVELIAKAGENSTFAATTACPAPIDR